MYKFKGFSVIPGLSDNTPGVVAPFGELSRVSESYSREQGQYSNPSYADVYINSFLSHDDLDQSVTQPAVCSNHVLRLCQYLYDTYVADNMPADAASLVTAITTAFSSGGAQYDANITLSNITIGEVIAHPDNVTYPNKAMPDYVAWTMDDAVSGDTFSIRIWFVDARFQAQYDEYELVVIPPLANVDDLDNSSLSAVAAALNAVTQADLISWIEAAKNGVPETRIVSQPLVWHNPSDFAQTLNTSWTVIVYGIAGDQYTNIEQAIKDYLNDNATEDLTHWQTIYPTLFAASEFYLIPMWDQMAIEEMVQTAGVYSPIQRPNLMLPIAETYSFGYNSVDVAQALTLQPSQYKGLSYLAVGNINNQDGFIRLDQMFEDYINVATSSLDFNRMAPETQGFITFLNSLFQLAETADENTIMPAGFSLSNRDNNLYIVGRYNETDFIVVTKDTYITP